MGKTIYHNLSQISFTDGEWNKVKSYASFLVFENGQDIRDLVEYPDMNEIHIIARGETTESFCIRQDRIFSERDYERGYEFNFTKTYHVQPFEEVVRSILSYAMWLCPHIVLDVSGDDE